MATLRNQDSGRTARLSVAHQIGRNPPADLLLSGTSVSGLHALVTWSRGLWMLRDLGSRNGTTVDGERLFPGVDMELRLGAEVCFGSVDECWVLDDLQPPVPMLMNEQGEVRLLTGGAMAIPDEGEGSGILLKERSGTWWWHGGARAQALQDRQTFQADGTVWKVYLTGVSPSTTDDITSVGYVQLRFRVSRDEEHIELDCLLKEGVSVLPSRAHSYLLLTLARRRLLERSAGVEEIDAGWMATDDLCHGLRIGRGALYTQVYRARKQLEDAGHPVLAELIVEHRRSAAQLRLGIGQIEVAPL